MKKYITLLLSLTLNMAHAETVFELAKAKHEKNQVESLEALISTIKKSNITCKVVSKCYPLWDGSSCDMDPNEFVAANWKVIIRTFGDASVGTSEVIGFSGIIGKENTHLKTYVARSVYDEPSKIVMTSIGHYNKRTGYHYSLRHTFALSEDAQQLTAYSRSVMAGWLSVEQVHVCKVSPKSAKAKIK